MNTFKAILERRSVREFNAKNIPKDHINLILESGAYAPSTGGLKDYRFIVVDKPKLISQIADLSDQYWINKAPIVIAVCTNTALNKKFYGKRSQKYTIQNAAAATQNMLLAATALNIHSCWVGDYNDKEVKKLLKIEDGADLHNLIVLGYTDKKIKPSKEPDLNVNVFWNEYGNRIKNMNLLLREYAKELEERIEEFNLQNKIKIWQRKLNKFFNKK